MDNANTLLQDRAEGCLNFYQLCDLIGDLLIKAWGPEWRDRFTPEYPKGLEAQSPVITYTLISKQPSPEKKERRPRLMAEIEDPGFSASIYGRTFHVVGQFDIWSRSGREANELSVKFAEFMDAYTDYFKRKGIVQMFFVEQLEDERLNRWREDWYIRSLRYLLLLEELKVEPMGVLDEVDIKISDLR